MSDTVEPAEEARGPHLPDALTRNWATWIFVILAIGYVAWYVTHLDVKPDASFADFVIYALQAVPAVTAILLPAAVLARHPDAWSRARTLLFGTILYAAVQGMLILVDPLQAFFETVTPASPDLPFLVPLAVTYNALISLVAAFGLGYIAVGLSMARRYEGGSRWTTGWFVPVATVFGTRRRRPRGVAHPVRRHPDDPAADHLPRVVGRPRRPADRRCGRGWRRW